MVTIQRNSSKGNSSSPKKTIVYAGALICIVLLLWFLISGGNDPQRNSHNPPNVRGVGEAKKDPLSSKKGDVSHTKEEEEKEETVGEGLHNGVKHEEEEEEEQTEDHHHHPEPREDGAAQQQQQQETAAVDAVCPYTSLSDLTPEERYPVASSDRHMVDPPKGGPVTLVCCQTTKGPWNVMVHTKWAPRGAERFLEMIKAGYFTSKVPMMRCLKGFLCQFGLSSAPHWNSQYGENRLLDDTNWLPEGPKHRQNDKGVQRFAKGYLAYAGAGRNSRTNQFIVALRDNGPLAGGSPWEVPWGELVGSHSYHTLDRIHTGYDEHGPGQGILHRQGMTTELEQEFPLLDYITSCTIVDQAK